MKIAVEGCAHGELESIYDTIEGIEKAEQVKIDLLLCCGDFQATRNLEDLQTMAVPQKYLDICTFYKYYSGERVAPILTIFIGGNHEASNYLQELPYGGWVAPNIYYLGYAGVVRVNGIRIAGLSGIYKGHDFLRGRHEFPPYTVATRKSVYHVRQLEVFRMKQLSGHIDICMSHDWPRGIYNYGNKAQLVRFKPHFRDEVDSNQLGSRPCEELLKLLKPEYWFAAHMHCKFAAIVPHEPADNTESDENAPEERVTRFLALDKCLPQRRFLQVLDYASADHTDDGEINFEYDLEWLTILYLTNHLTNVKTSNYYLPGPRAGNSTDRFNFTPTQEELQQVREKFGGDLRIPENFCRTVPAYEPNERNISVHPPQPKAFINPQSMQFCDTLGIDDPLSLAMLISGHELSHSSTLDGSDATLNDSSSLLISEQTDLDSSNFGDTSLQHSSPIQRRSGCGLNLPKPVSTTITEECRSPPHERTNPDEVQLSEDDCEAPALAVKTDFEGKYSDDIESALITSTSPMSTTSPTKKFKRRNQNIYQEDENES